MPIARDRFAAAPISWGVSEVPDWGHQIPPVQVLADMRKLGFVAAETGPEGYFGDTAEQIRATVDGLRIVGGFHLDTFHDPGYDPVPAAVAAAAKLAALDADVLVVAASAGTVDYNAGAGEIDRTLLHENLERVATAVQSSGVRVVLHPHLGTAVAGPDDIAAALAATTLALCLDTGHIAAAGGDPLAIAREHSSRIGHIHLKDVDRILAMSLRAGAFAYDEAVGGGLWTPLGDGSLPIAEIIETLLTSGYDGWWVLEQDLRLAGQPEVPGPITEVRASVDFLLDEGLLA